MAVVLLCTTFYLELLNAVCPNCNAEILSGVPSCNSCGTPVTSSGTGGFCSSCGTPLASKYSPCSKCGHVKTVFNPHVNPNHHNPPVNPNPHNPISTPGQFPMQYKSEGIALVLAIVFGLLCLCGIGHLYVGKIGKGVAILLGNIILLAVGIATIFVGIGFVLLILYLIVFIWQMIDAHKLCVEYNRYFHQCGRPPW